MILTVTLNPCVHQYVRFRNSDPEATVVRPVQGTVSSGGKGLNAARAIRILGGEVRAIGTAGGVRGEQLRACLACEQIDAEMLGVAAETRLSVCLYDETAGRFREFVEEGEDCTEAEVAGLRERFARILPDCTAVSLNGSSPGPHLDPLLAEFCQTARQASKLVVLDSYGNAGREAVRATPSWLRANREEIESSYGIRFPDGLADFFARQQDLGIEGIMVTDGAGEVRCYCSDGEFVARPPVVTEINPVGSGDAATGAFILACTQGHDVGTALRWGLAAGAANAEELGICSFRRERWEELVAQVEIEQRSRSPR